MTLHEIAERRRIRRKHKQPSQAEAERRRQQRERALYDNNDNCVLTFPEWVALNGFSKAIGRRVIKAGKVRKDVSPRSVAAFVVAAQAGIIGTAKNAQSEELMKQAGEALFGYLDSLKT